MLLSYFELNKTNKKNMSKEVAKVHYDWMDSVLLDRLCLSFETINSFSDESDPNKDIIKKINGSIIKLKNNSLSICSFLKAIKKPINSLKSSRSKYYYRDFEDYKRMINMHTRIIIHAPGGMGKSRFIYDLEEKLSSLSIKHLVLYGKYFSNIDSINFEEIKNISKRENFVFVFDSINEIQSEEERELLFRRIEEIKNVQNISIILTYRDFSIDENLLNRFEDFRKYYFNGVDYDSALQYLTQKLGKSALQYEYILETNNPLYLNALNIMFEKGMKRNNGNIVQITGLLEQYVKSVFNTRRQGEKYWGILKQIAKIMFDGKRKRVTKKEISSVITDVEKRIILEDLLQNGFLIKHGDIYFFAMDTMADYLIIRYAFNLYNNGDEKSIQELFYSLPELKDIGALCLIDKNGINNLTLQMIKKFNLRFDYELLSRIAYDKKDIEYLRRRIKHFDLVKMFAYMGGLTDKPFNCVNKINRLFLKNTNDYFGFCMSFQSPNDYSSLIEKRLKNIVVYLSKTNCCENEEYLYFAIWSLGIPNEEIWMLAKKTLLLIFDKSDKMAKKGIYLYKKIDNDFIRDGIVETIACTSKNKNKIIKRFLNGLIKDPHFLNAFNIGKIERHFERKINPCSYNKDDFYKNIDYRWLSKEKIETFQRLYLHHDILMCFEVSHSGYVTSTLSFLNIDKVFVNKINEELSFKYKCFYRGECSGYQPAENYLQKQYGKIKEIPAKALAVITAYFLEYLLSKFNISLEDLEKGYKYRFASYSMLHKFLKIAESYMLGSLMCNYYTKEFGSFNGYDNPIIGYQPYDPLMYETDYYSLNCLIPLFNEDAEGLNNKMLKRIVDDSFHDKVWSDDVEGVVLKVNNLFEPITFKKNEWVPICFVCEVVDNYSETSPREYVSFRIEYNTKYHIKRYEEHRYNTIEFKTYNGNVLDYSSCKSEKGICHEINNFSRNYTGLIDRSVVLPPPEIISELGLEIEQKNGCYLKGKEKVIIFDNNPVSYYNSPIKHSIYIRKDFYQKLTHKISFFGYTERYNYKSGYSRKASIYFEKEFSKPLKYYKNYEQRKKHNIFLPKKCLICKKKVGIIAKKARDHALNDHIIFKMSFDKQND